MSLHTIDEHCDLVLHHLYFTTNAGHLSINTIHSVVYIMGRSQILRSGYSCLLGRRLAGFLNASSISVLPANLFRYFSEKRSANDDLFCKYNIIIYSLVQLCFVSFVAIPRIESTSTMIFTIMSVISGVGETAV